MLNCNQNAYSAFMDALLISWREGFGHSAPWKELKAALQSYLFLTMLSCISCAGSNVPDGCRPPGVRAGQQGPAALSWHRPPLAPGLLAVPGALPRRVHACTQARAGREQQGCLAISTFFLARAENTLFLLGAEYA